MFTGAYFKCFKPNPWISAMTVTPAIWVFSSRATNSKRVKAAVKRRLEVMLVGSHWPSLSMKTLLPCWSLITGTQTRFSRHTTSSSQGVPALMKG